MPSDKQNRYYTTTQITQQTIDPHAQSHTHHTQTTLKVDNKQQKRKTLSYANMVRYGRELNIPQTKITQTTPKQKQVNTTQTGTHSTPCGEQAQTVTTRHTTVGTQTDDTPLASTATLTATVDYIIEQILGKQEGGKADTTSNSGDREGGLERRRVLEFKQKGRETESQLTHQRTHTKKN